MLVMLSPLIYSDQQLLRRWTRQPPRGTTFEMLVMLSPLIYSDQQLLRRWTRQPVWRLSDAEVSSRSARGWAPVILQGVEKQVGHGATQHSKWVHSSVVRATDCRSAGPWFKSRCALCFHDGLSLQGLRLMLTKRVEGWSGASLRFQLCCAELWGWAPVILQGVEKASGARRDSTQQMGTWLSG